jgi:hypothetical protein
VIHAHECVVFFPKAYDERADCAAVGTRRELAVSSFRAIIRVSTRGMLRTSSSAVSSSSFLFFTFGLIAPKGPRGMYRCRLAIAGAEGRCLG